jgi:hypothetical protein
LRPDPGVLHIIMRPGWVVEGLEPYETTYAAAQRRQNRDARAHVTCSFIRKPVFFLFQSGNPGTLPP